MDAFHWKYLRMSKWQTEAFGHLLPFDANERCRHKVQQDFAFIDVRIDGSNAEVTTLSRRLTNIDVLSIVGRK